MLDIQRIPNQGLVILEELQKKHPNNDWVKRSLINGYMLLRKDEKLKQLLQSVDTNRTDTYHLKLKSWQSYQNNDLIAQKQCWDKILVQNYYASYHASMGTLVKVSEKPINIYKDEIICFTQVYNEMLRLPNLLTYYRSLGISQFFIIDNNSTDNCQEFLLQQPDVNLFWTKDSHNQAGEGMVWYQYLIDTYLKGNWILVVDADEFLVYPDCENRKLPELISFLDKYDYEAMASFMLDMFPQNLEQQLSISPNISFIEQAPYFYNHYRFMHHPEPPYFDVHGGIFYYLDNFLPPLIKTPLINTSKGVRYIQTHHRITPARIAPITSAFLHFKFIGDFYKKSQQIVTQKLHWAGGGAYRKYMRMFDNHIQQDFDFTKLDKTIKYQNSQQLVNLGLIKYPDSWKNFIPQTKTIHNLRTPKKGKEILEQLYHKHAYHRDIFYQLINSYIILGYHDKALSMINQIPANETNVESLRLFAWKYHKEGNKQQEKIISENIYNKIYKPELHSLLGKLVYLSQHQIDIIHDDICLFCVERNEMLCLPFLLEYYRKLGVTKFFFIDNNSTDGSREFLLKQDDCFVFFTESSHSEAGGGMNWINHLIDKYTLDNQWYIVADADEFLVYANSENISLKHLTKYLDHYGYESVSSFMIDMFPENIENQKKIQSGDNLLEKCPYFCNNYRFYHGAEASYLTVYGGIFQSLLPYQKDWLYKTLLMKKGVKPITSNHLTTPAKIANITSALFHFKFKGDFKLKSLEETYRKEHNDGGIRYQKYVQLFDTTINENFDFTKLDKTIKYQNSQQLIHLGLIQTSNEWEDFIQFNNLN